MKFREVKVNEVLDLVQEAEECSAFLSTVGKTPFSVDKFISYSKEVNNKIFGLFDGKTIVGFITLFLDSTKVAIGPMYVGNKFRGKRYGKKQVEEVIEWARKAKYTRLFTKTWKENYASKAIFKSLGFKFICEIPNDRVNGDSTIEFELILS